MVKMFKPKFNTKMAKQNISKLKSGALLDFTTCNIQKEVTSEEMLSLSQHSEVEQQNDSEETKFTKNSDQFAVENQNGQIKPVFEISSDKFSDSFSSVSTISHKSVMNPEIEISEELTSKLSNHNLIYEAPKSEESTISEIINPEESKSLKTVPPFVVKSEGQLPEMKKFDGLVSKQKGKPRPPLEKYNVIIPENLQEVGIKRKNLSQNELEKLKIVYHNILNDPRTTVMIKNIPNKYSQSQLQKDYLNKTHDGCYDFFYVPIDFINKCNVGYAFINFKCVEDVKSFYSLYHGMQWKHFNSGKICQLTYAKIQGKARLSKHFKTSSIMFQKDEKLKPIMYF